MLSYGTSTWSRPHCTPTVWIACMVLMCGVLQALVPSVQKPSLVWTTPPVHDGVHSTPLTPADASKINQRGTVQAREQHVRRRSRGVWERNGSFRLKDFQMCVWSGCAPLTEQNCASGRDRAVTNPVHDMTEEGERQRKKERERALNKMIAGVRGEELTKPCGNQTNLCIEYCSICDTFNFTKPLCYEILIELCDGNFTSEMAALNSSNWCMWDKVKSPYNEYTECTETVAECLLLPWPNRVVEQKFVDIHSMYFQECLTETLQDPPPNVVLALVMTPICLIPAMVVLVVMKTKNGDWRS